MRKHNLSMPVFLIAALCVFSFSALQAQTSEPRLALVIGNAQYHTAPLATAANDAGLIAQTLTTAGFDVTGAADLDQDSMRRAFRDFLNKLQAAGPHAISFIYLAGYGLQYAGENYFVPVDASLARDSDIPVEAIRVSDLTHALDGLPLDARIFVLDAAHANPFPVKGNPLAGGLALADVENNALDAFNAAPGTIAPDQNGSYGIYARALAEMLRFGGVPIDEVFARTRLRVNELSHGAFVPWDMSKLSHPLILLAGNPDAAPLPGLQNYRELRARPIRDFPSADEAYAAAVEIDTLSAYQEFLGAYPLDPLAGRVRALLAARREALTWNRTVLANTPDAYWSYMRRYPRGPHYFDARRRLASVSAPLEPPPRFNMYDFDGLPPPPQDEYVTISRPELIFDGPDYAPAPPPPAYFLPPPPSEFRRLPSPEPRADGVLPTPEAIPLPFARPAQRPGVISQPNLTPQGGTGAEPNSQAGPPHGPVAPNAAAGQPEAVQPDMPPPLAGQPHPAAGPSHSLPVPPQTPPDPAVPPALPVNSLPGATPPLDPTPRQMKPHAGPAHPGAQPGPQQAVPLRGAAHVAPPLVRPWHVPSRSRAAPPRAAARAVSMPHVAPPRPAPRAVAPKAAAHQPPRPAAAHPAPPKPEAKKPAGKKPNDPAH